MRRLVLVGWVVLAACDRDHEPVVPAESTAPEASPPKTAAESPAPGDGAKAEVGSGPIAIAPASAAPEVRTAAVKRLLAGGSAVEQLPEASTEPGAPFDPSLVDTMTPRARGPRRVPRIRQLPPKISGALDKDVVRRIVRAHINEIRYCYNQVLVVDPVAGGAVTVEFQIGASGKVLSAEIGKSELGDPGADACIAKAVERWKFPRPSDGATVEVSYTFDLEPG